MLFGNNGVMGATNRIFEQETKTLHLKKKIPQAQSVKKKKKDAGIKPVVRLTFFSFTNHDFNLFSGQVQIQ